MKDKNILGKIILGVFLFGFFLSARYVFSATLDIAPATGSYRVGDSIKVKVQVSSPVSINALSAKIDFPSEYLSLVNFSKSGSLVDLWPEEPLFSNSNGSISFDGVILKGYQGDGGNILSLNFKAKKEGVVNLKFSSASVLANDGLGTEVLSGNLPAVFSIEKALPKEEEPKTAKPTPSVCVEDLSKITSVKVNEIETSCNLPRNSILTFFLPAVIFILLLAITYILFFIFKVKNFLKRKLNRMEGSLSKNFETLEKDIEKEMILSSQKQTNQKLAEDETTALLKFSKDIKKTKETALNEIKDIEKET